MFDNFTLAHIVVGGVMVALFGTAILWMIIKNRNGE